MAVKQGTKRLDELNPDNLANVKAHFTVGELQRAALYKVDISGKIMNKNAEGIFLLNPSAWEENKSAKWVSHEVPGQSDPIWQWISSGPRTVTFDALVTADTSDYKVAQAEVEQQKAKPKSELQAVADYAISLFKIQVPPAANQDTMLKNDQVLDISNRLDYYRSLLYPQYSDPNQKGVAGRLKASPPLLVLYAGNSISNLAYSDRITNKHDVWILTDLKIRITKQLSNLTPMEAVVTFTLAQYNIRSFDSNRFYKDNK